MGFILFACPQCQKEFSSHGAGVYSVCTHCGQTFQTNVPWLDLCITADPINQKTEAAYKIYSKFYVPFAFLAYWLVWRGRILKHIAFFRNLLQQSSVIVDIATGDGSLTKVALFGSKKSHASNVYAIDLSSDMLLKAKRNLHGCPVTLVRGDVCRLPFVSQSISAISCFGGLNSFPSGENALQEMARCLMPNGILRGSVLLLPATPWRKKLVLSWIKKGYQTEEVTEEKFLMWAKNSNLKLTCLEKYGDVLLFELKSLASSSALHQGQPT